MKKRQGFNRSVAPLAVLLAFVSTTAGQEPADTSSLHPPTEDGLPPRKISFNREVRSILSENCFVCHGPDRNTRMADLRLDRRESATGERGGKRAIVPGSSQQSELVRRILHADEAVRMPPSATGFSLTKDEKQTLSDWIEQGAEYEAHWSYIKPERPNRPHIDRTPALTSELTAWLANPIDGFVLAKLTEQKMTPASRTDPATLLRRLSLDLVGLPPTSEAVDAYLADPGEDAYRRLVDRLLASPHYGERMAISWLDLVRYADSNGYHGDEFRSIWPYRDYVIDAFNNNKPYDRFTVEQLAGDLLPEPTREQQIASGFNRLNQITAEGGSQPKEYRVKYNADRVRAVSNVWLGATLGCAECHDHKFDPFKTEDFYSLAAFFADLDEDDVYPIHDDWAPILRLPDNEQAAELARLDALLAELRKTARTPTDVLAEGQRNWEVKAAAKGPIAGEWLPARPVAYSSLGGATLELLDDFSMLSSGIVPLRETYTLTLQTNLKDITGVRLQAIDHPSFKRGLTRLRHEYHMNEFEVEVRKGRTGRTRPVKIVKAETDVKGGADKVGNVIDGDINSAWFHYSQEKYARDTIKAVFTFKRPIRGGRGTTITVRLKHMGGAMFDRAAFGRVRLSLTTASRPALAGAAAIPELVVDAARSRNKKRSARQAEVIAAYYRTIAPELEGVRNRIEEAKLARRKLLKEIPTTLVSRQRKQPREVRVLARGSWMDESGRVVGPALPSFLPPLDVEGRRPTRLDLANWMVSEENPLTARVFVNRLWRLFFGRGLSNTLDDLGSQGEWPTHPELLDWLADEFVRSGWDVKHKVRLIVTSEAYRQTSNVDDATRSRDQGNRWIGRQVAFRLEAEIVRDIALAVSGLLDPDVGGPSVKPYQPEGYWEHLNFPKRKYKHDVGSAQYRRGLYTHWQRTFVHPSLRAFDAPTREECVAQRSISNTPLQALVLLNDPSYVEAARVFAARILGEGGATSRSRLRWAFREVVSRSPVMDEESVLIEVYEKHLAEYRADAAVAAALLEIGLAPAPENLDPGELAAWTSVARILFNLHETVTRS